MIRSGRVSPVVVGFEALLPATSAQAAMDRDAAVEAVVAFVGVGMIYGNSGLSGDGGLALVGAVAVFVVMMSGIGIGLSRRH